MMQKRAVIGSFSFLSFFFLKCPYRNDDLDVLSARAFGSGYAERTERSRKLDYNLLVIECLERLLEVLRTEADRDV